MKLTSPAFEHEGRIPKEYTCQGADINPELRIDGVPDKARTLTVIVDDPDAPMGTWDHWIVFNIPVASRIEKDSIPGTQGTNDFERLSYGGPCPPSGTHRYFFKVYALDSELRVAEGASKAEIERAMKGHVLDQAELIGVYSKE